MSGELATNRRDQQQLGMLAPNIPHAELVYVITLVVQDVLGGWRPHNRRQPRADAALLDRILPCG